MWLHIPNSYLTPVQPPESLSAQDMAGSTSALLSPNPDLELWVLSSGKLTPQPLSWRGWKTRPFIQRLYGTILQPSTANDGAARWIASLPDIPVSHFRRQAKNKQKPIRAISGPTSAALSANAGLNGYCSKTSKGISTVAFWMSPETYRQWALQSKRDCSARMKQVRDTGGAVYSCWPTPTTGGGNTSEVRLDERGLCFQTPLSKAGNQVHLSEMAWNWTLLWLYLKATGWKPTAPPVKYPYMRPLHLTIAPGTRRSPGDLTYNPSFTDWMMGWPSGWSGTSRPVTEFARWLQRMRGALSKLECSGKD